MLKIVSHKKIWQKIGKNLAKIWQKIGICDSKQS
jgi:hypothetical protein